MEKSANELKSKFIIFIDTFKTLGSILGGSTEKKDLTEAEKEAMQISKLSEKNIEKLEERVSTVSITKSKKNKVKYEKSNVTTNKEKEIELKKKVEDKQKDEELSR